MQPTIALGLRVHRGGAALGADARDVIGDALWAPMMAWWVGAAARTTLGHLVLGSGFDSRELLAYAAGVAMAALLEPLARSLRPVDYH